MHSLHAYFLVAGDVNAPIVYEVELARDGKSFSNRRVVAIQHGQPIFNMTASFQVPEEGLEHAAPRCRSVPGPEGLADVRELPAEMLEKVPEKMRRFLTHERPFEFRPVEPIHVIAPPRAAPSSATSGSRPSTRCPTMPTCTATCSRTSPTISSSRRRRCRTASISPRATCSSRASITRCGSTGRFARTSGSSTRWKAPMRRVAAGSRSGALFTRDGALVASTAQEGVVRVWAGR